MRGVLPAKLQVDKIIHIGEYGLLALLCIRMLNGMLPSATEKRLFAFAVVLTVLYGVSDELHQSFVPGRSSDPYDLLADVAGALLGARIYIMFIRRQCGAGISRGKGRV